MALCSPGSSALLDGGLTGASGHCSPPRVLGRTEPPGAVIQELTPVSAGPPWTGGWGSTAGGSRCPGKSGLWASGGGRGEQDLSSHMSLGLSCALLQGLPGDPGPRGPVGPPGLKGEKVRGQWGWSTLQLDPAPRCSEMLIPIS